MPTDSHNHTNGLEYIQQSISYYDGESSFNTALIIAELIFNWETWHLNSVISTHIQHNCIGVQIKHMRQEQTSNDGHSKLINRTILGPHLIMMCSSSRKRMSKLKQVHCKFIQSLALRNIQCLLIFSTYLHTYLIIIIHGAYSKYSSGEIRKHWIKGHLEYCVVEWMVAEARHLSRLTCS